MFYGMIRVSQHYSVHFSLVLLLDFFIKQAVIDHIAICDSFSEHN